MNDNDILVDGDGVIKKLVIVNPSDPNILYGENGSVYRLSPLRRIIPIMDNKEEDAETGDNQSNRTEDSVDTGFQIYSNLKRRRSPKTETNIPKGKYVKTNETVTKNRFELLDKANDARNTSNDKKEKPTPIYIRGVLNTIEIWNWMLKLKVKDFDIKILRKGQEAKLQLSSVENYKSTQTFLQANKVPHYTYQLKSARAVRAVIKGLDPRIEPAQIIVALKELQINARSVHNILKRNKEPTSLFIVELEPDINKVKGHHPIFDLKRLLHMVITVEEPMNKKEPKQCYNCQEFGHTKNMCQLDAICVICAERHRTNECKKNKDDPTAKKCNNCGENHTSNWKGCQIYQTFLERMNPKQRREQRMAKNQQKLDLSKPIVTPMVQPGLSYAQAAASSIDSNNGMPMATSDIVKLMFMMQTNINTMQVNITQMIKKQSEMEDVIQGMSTMINNFINKK